MHELSIAQSILDAVQREMTEKNLPVVSEVGVQVGALSGVLPNALQFCFEAIIKETPLADCRLIIEHIPVRGRCKACGRSFEVEHFFFCCPTCQSGQIDVTHGYELDIAYLEIEDEDVVTNEP
ncbi:MAG: hydrogenase maturation nickel metallochaperone HypA [Rhodothermales bacterium]